MLALKRAPWHNLYVAASYLRRPFESVRRIEDDQSKTIGLERGFDREDYSAEDDLCKGVRRMSTTPQKAPEPRAPFRHYSYRDADERPPAWQRKSAF